MNGVLVADSVGKAYRERRVLVSASLWVLPGRITALLGRNGCGKTTLLRIITGLARADYGMISFRGRMHPRPDLHRLSADGLFYVPERELLCRGRDVGAHFLALNERYSESRDHAAHAIQMLGVAPLLDRPPEMLSTGERRRAELALAVARSPACLLADEPFMGIGPRDAETVAGAIRAMAARGAGVLVTGHEVEMLFDVADEVVWMTSGTTHSLGAPADAARHDQFRREYLGPRGPLRQLV